MRVGRRRGISPISSAGSAALMISLPHEPGLGGVLVVLAGGVAVLIASVLGMAIAEAAGLPTTWNELLGRATNALVVGLAGQAIVVAGVERTLAANGQDWIYALAIWVAALMAMAMRTAVMATWVARTTHRNFWVAIYDESMAAGVLSVASATTAVMIVLSRDVIGLWGPVLFSLPLVLSLSAARRYSMTRKTYRESLAALSRLTDIAGYTPPAHARRVADLAIRLAHRRGMSQREIDTVEYAALLHDLGQVALDQPIPGGATVLAAPRDQERIADHAVAIMRHSGILEDAAVILAQQATRFRLMREEDQRIPLGSRIIKLANAYEDFTGGSDSPDVVEVALERIQLGLGYEYDPELVDELMALVVDRDLRRRRP